MLVCGSMTLPIHVTSSILEIMWLVACLYKALFCLHGHFLIWSMIICLSVFRTWKKPEGLLLPVKVGQCLNHYNMLHRKSWFIRPTVWILHPSYGPLTCWSPCSSLCLFLLLFVPLFNVRITYIIILPCRNIKITSCSNTVWDRFCLMSNCELAHAITGNSSFTSLLRLGL